MRRKWQQTVDLYNYLIPKFDRKKPSILYYWTLGHLAGALQRLGHYPESAYRYSVIFQELPLQTKTSISAAFAFATTASGKKPFACASRMMNAQPLYLMRAARSHTYTVEDMETIYRLDPRNPQLELMLISDVQQLERIFLRTRYY